MSAYFCADNSLLTSAQVVRLQRGFDVVKELFDLVVLQKNFRKTVGMVCQPCRAIGVHSVGLYIHWMVGEYMTHQDRQFKKVFFPKCTVYLASGSLVIHLQVQH